MASLDSVRRKIGHAESHLHLIKAEINRYLSDDSCEMVPNTDSAADALTYSIRARNPIPDGVSLAVGDFLQNLRSSLDYLVWELVLSSGNQPGEKTMFPVCMKPKGFQDAIRGHRLDGASPEAVALIEKFQPYCYREPEAHSLAILDKLTNINKHRRILFTRVSAFSVTGMLDALTAWTDDNPDGARLVHDANSGENITAAQVAMQGDVIPFVAFNEGAVQGMDVGIALGSLVIYVNQALEIFVEFF